MPEVTAESLTSSAMTPLAPASPVLAVTTVLSPTETIDPLLAITMWVPLAMIEPVALMETLRARRRLSWTGLEADGAESVARPCDTPDTRGWVIDDGEGRSTERGPNVVRPAHPHRRGCPYDRTPGGTARDGRRVDEMNVCLGLRRQHGTRPGCEVATACTADPPALPPLRPHRPHRPSRADRRPRDDDRDVDGRRRRLSGAGPPAPERRDRPFHLGCLASRRPWPRGAILR